MGRKEKSMKETKYSLETESDESNYVLRFGDSSIKYAKRENTVEAVIEKLKRMGVVEVEVIGGKNNG